MDRGVKIVLACGVLLGGIGLAMLFRRPSPPRRPPKPPSPDRLVLRQQNGAEEAEPGIADRLTAQIGPRDERTPPSGASRPSTASPLGTEAGEPPPVLARSYPPFFDEPASSPAPSGPPAKGAQADRSAGSARRHQIVDGDTLRGLAERYLGEADRYLEIYEANRELLPSPEVLPIGAELSIPPRRGGPARADPGPQCPLVPVVPPS